ncbi:hypothetical protein HA72_1038 [Metallosphaera sedula]|uniref:Uncharacterized protein n=2 Tax=Metallosphaera sedula TaxID=43687 RepID=A4YFK1_METS5|nr:hypothetical protein Msed_1038 [Metallosphaera sedula DSM 5348]AIM27189.1 hypothetical protein HA72_1038 [Metallosphaera sedula]
MKGFFFSRRNWSLFLLLSYPSDVERSRRKKLNDTTRERRRKWKKNFSMNLGKTIMTPRSRETGVDYVTTRYFILSIYMFHVVE